MPSICRLNRSSYAFWHEMHRVGFMHTASPRACNRAAPIGSSHSLHSTGFGSFLPALALPWNSLTISPMTPKAAALGAGFPVVGLADPGRCFAPSPCSGLGRSPISLPTVGTCLAPTSANPTRRPRIDVACSEREPRMPLCATALRARTSLDILRTQKAPHARGPESLQKDNLRRVCPAREAIASDLPRCHALWRYTASI